MENSQVMIDKTRYEDLLKSERKLNALECAGVDNWGGYSDAMEWLKEDDFDD